jgi:hypothetical protein
MRERSIRWKYIPDEEDNVAAYLNRACYHFTQ